MLTFANPLFLWGLLGLAAPVLIHLINRDLFRPVLFPSIRFIFRGKLPVEHKRRLRDLLLLALRMLLFAAVVSALARPQWQPSLLAASSTASGAESLVIVVDGSASMQGWGSRDAAVAKVEELLDTHGSAPAGLVISGAGPFVVEALTTDHARLRAALRNYSPRPVAGNHNESLRQALRLFKENASGVIAVVSDFQQSDWSPASFSPTGNHVRVEWHPVATTERANAGIVNATSIPLLAGGRQVIAQVRNFGSEPVNRTVTVRAGSTTLERALDIPPGASGSVAFILSDSEAASAEILLDPDAYPGDDRFFLWLSKPPPVPVLAIIPTSDEPERAEELFFLSRALGTETETQWLRFSVAAAEPGGITPEILHDKQTIFLLGAAPYLSDAEWALLSEKVRSGTRLIVTPGNAPARQFQTLASQELIDLQYDGLAGIDHRQFRPAYIGEVEPSSALGELFSGDAANSLSHVAIYRHARLRPNERESSREETSTTEILLQAATGDPLLFRAMAGSGEVLVFAFPFATGWTDLPLSTAFLPMIRELVGGDLPPDYGILNLDTGVDRATIAARLNLPSDAPGLGAIDTLTPGVHLAGDVPIVLNLPRSESLTATTHPVDLATAITPATAADGSGAATAASAVAGSQDPRIPLWPWLAAAAFLFFLIEMPLAARLRRERALTVTAPPAIPAEPSSNPS